MSISVTALIALQELVQRFRQTGCTESLVIAAKESDGILIVYSEPEARRLRKNSRYTRIFSIDYLDRIKGMTGPLFIDNSVIAYL